MVFWRQRLPAAKQRAAGAADAHRLFISRGDSEGENKRETIAEKSQEGSIAQCQAEELSSSILVAEQTAPDCSSGSLGFHGVCEY